MTERPKPRRVDAFGQENLEAAVEEALERTGAFFDYEIGEQPPSIRLQKTQEVLDYDPDEHLEVFRALFNPETGSLRDFPEDLSYSFRIDQTVTMVYEAQVGAVQGGFSASEIERIQEGSVDGSFTEGYSEERFDELYREVR